MAALARSNWFNVIRMSPDHLVTEASKCTLTVFWIFTCYAISACILFLWCCHVMTKRLPRNKKIMFSSMGWRSLKKMIKAVIWGYHRLVQQKNIYLYFKKKIKDIGLKWKAAWLCLCEDNQNAQCVSVPRFITSFDPPNIVCNRQMVFAFGRDVDDLMALIYALFHKY